MKAAHIENINKNLKAPKTYVKSTAPSGASIPALASVAADFNLGVKICPKCGGKLVLRTASNGANAGSKFWGCSGFPECRYIKNV